MRLFTYRKPKKLVLSLVLLLSTLLTQAQLKVGDNPTNIQKSSVLELESTRQGLLLPRLTDTVAINLLTPPDGMIIYLTADNSLRLRSNGSWKKIADLSEASANWSLTGNSGTDSALNFIGTVDGKPLSMRTNNAERLHISADGNIGIGTTTPSANLDVNGTVKFENLALDSTTLQVLVLAPDGSVYKRTVSTSIFQNAIRAINGIQKETLSLTASSNTSVDTVTVVNTPADSTIAINLPVQDGASATKPYGFLTLADWTKIQSATQSLLIGAVATVGNANGAHIDSSGSTRTIVLHPADATNPGIVTAGTQTFGGNKTFNGNTTIKGTTTLDSVATNNTLDSVLVISNGLVQKRQVSAAAFGNAIRRINNNTDTAQYFAFRNSGTDLTVSTANNDSVYLNVPDAATGARGVVSTGAQTFAGNKGFQDSVTASKAVLVGTGSSANSTVQVNGSLSLAIKSVTTDYTVTGADNTILANTTSGAIIITLPAPTNFAGRIYTIKKIGTGGIDKELTITPASGTIDGGSNYIIYNDYTYVALQTDGTNWYVIKK
jgi:hypothetical protein